MPETKAQHTPGPWEIAVATAHAGAICTLHGAEDALGDPTWLEVWSKNWIHRCSNDTGANARLIAAAPDLLEALTKIAAYDKWYCHVTTGARMECQACNEPEHTEDCPVRIARTAIASAEALKGETT